MMKLTGQEMKAIEKTREGTTPHHTGLYRKAPGSFRSRANEG
jgi:hypothetical protein